MAQVAAPRRPPEIDARIASIYDRYASSLRTRCLRLTGDAVAAEDLVQDVFAQFLAKVGRPPASMNVHGYLLAMAHNLWVNQVRGSRALSLEEIDAQPADDRIEHDPLRTLLLGEQRKLVRQGTSGLTPRQRRALTLRELEGRSYSEIGAELGLGTNAVAQVVWRARHQLRRALRRSQVDVERLPETCRDMLDDLSDRLDNAERRGTAELETHIAGCQSCRRTLASFQEAGSRLRGAVPLVPLAAIMARAATGLRGCLDAPVGIGTAVAVGAAVVAGGGGGAALLVQHTRASLPPAAVAAPSAVAPAHPSAVRVPRSRPGGRPLVVLRTVSHARPSAPARAVRAERRRGGQAAASHLPSPARAAVPVPVVQAPPGPAPEPPATSTAPPDDSELHAAPQTASVESPADAKKHAEKLTQTSPATVAEQPAAVEHPEKAKKAKADKVAEPAAPQVADDVATNDPSSHGAAKKAAGSSDHGKAAQAGTPALPAAPQPELPAPAPQQAGAATAASPEPKGPKGQRGAAEPPPAETQAPPPADAPPPAPAPSADQAPTTPPADAATLVTPSQDAGKHGGEGPERP